MSLAPAREFCHGVGAAFVAPSTTQELHIGIAPLSEPHSVVLGVTLNIGIAAVRFHARRWGSSLTRTPPADSWSPLMV